MPMRVRTATRLPFDCLLCTSLHKVDRHAGTRARWQKTVVQAAGLVLVLPAASIESIIIVLTTAGVD